MAIIVDEKFTFLHMPKTGGISSYNLLDKISDNNFTLPYHTILDKIQGSEDLPIVIGSRDIDKWHWSYYNYVFFQMKQYPYHIHELFKETPTYEEFLNFSYNKECDFGKDMNNPDNAYGGFDYITTLYNDWWDYEGNLYQYMEDSLLCGKQPTYIIRQENFEEDWINVFEDMGIITDNIKEEVYNLKQYNKGAYQ